MALDPESLGSQVRVVREGRALSARRLAVLTGLSRASIGRIEDGTGNPTIESLSRIATALEVPISALLDSAMPPGKAASAVRALRGSEREASPGPHAARVVGAVETRVDSHPVVVCRQINKAWILHLPASSEAGELRVSLFTLRPGEVPSGLADSAHPEDDFSVVIGGAFDAQVGGQTYRLLEDDAIYIAGGQEHTFHLVGDAVGRMFNLTLPPRR